MNWFGQVVLQALLVATTTMLILWVPPGLKLFFVVFLIYFLFVIGRNPIAFWRRLARLVVMTALPSTISGINFRIQGHGSLASGLGVVDFDIEQASGEALPIIATVLVAAIAFDIVIYWLEQRKAGHSRPQRSEAASISLEADRSIELFHSTLIAATDHAITLIGARLLILGLVTIEVEGVVHARWAETDGFNRPVDHQNPLVVAAGTTSVVLIGAHIKRGVLAGWLRLLTGPALGWMRVARGEIRLRALPDTDGASLPIRLVRRA